MYFTYSTCTCGFNRLSVGMLTEGDTRKPLQTLRPLSPSTTYTVTPERICPRPMSCTANSESRLRPISSPCMMALNVFLTCTHSPSPRLEGKGQIDTAMRCYREALADNPEEETAKMRLGLLMAAKEKQVCEVGVGERACV